jgi:hypothetical protein
MKRLLAFKVLFFAIMFGNALFVSAQKDPQSTLPEDSPWRGLGDFDYINNIYDYSLSPQNEGETQMFLAGLPLDTLEVLVSQIETDSIRSYTRALESFQYRFVGTTASAESREWLLAKFEEFGYTPVLDTCSYGPAAVHNVMAYKQGISFPEKYIIIGAHYDAVPESPGAGDDGAGVAGVLEIARILTGRNTHYTFVFALFDAEEEGIIGSAHMADRFASNGDSVLAMLNMDEITWNNYTSSIVRLLYGPGQEWLAQLYGGLAQALSTVLLTPSYAGSSYLSDHYAFQSCGYNVLFTYNTSMSPYRHTSQDSSTYVNFDYAARVIRGLAATAVDLDYRYRPSLGLVFEYPDGIPVAASAETTTAFNVQISGIAGGAAVPGTGQFHYSIDGSTYNTIAMTESGDESYSAIIPILSCDNDVVYFYISAEEAGGGTFYDPEPANPYIIPIMTAQITVFSDDFETTTGWRYDGLWEIGSPLGWGNEMGSPDPIGGHNSANCLAYNIYGDYEHNLPARYATSPVMDCSELSNVHLKFWRWLGIQFYGYDYARIAVSNDGLNFINVWSNFQQMVGGYWIEDEVDLSSVADNQVTVYVRFIMGPTDASWSYCGWNIDDLEVYGFKCKTWICGDANGDTKINLLDVSYIISALYRGGPKPDPIQSADVNSDGKMNLLDVSYIINNLYRHGPAPNCP